MYNPDRHPDTEPTFPFLKPSGPTSGGTCCLKPEWQQIGIDSLREAASRGYKKHNPENYQELCNFIMENRTQLYVEGIEGGLSGKTLGAEIAFVNEPRFHRKKEPSFRELIAINHKLINGKAEL